VETKSALKIRDLHFSHSKRELFKGVNLEIGSHEFVTVMGKNGCGKSTLISLLLGALIPDRGQIQFWGGNREKFSRQIGWVVSEREFYPPFFKVSQLMKELARFYPSWDENLERRLCEGFRIDVNKDLSTLSLGESAKVKLIKAIAIRPKLVILDELTANLDPESKQLITRELIDLFASCEEMSVLYVSHSDEEALRLSDRVLHLDSNGLKESA